LTPARAAVRTLVSRRRGGKTVGKQAMEPHSSTVSLGTRSAQVAKVYDPRVWPIRAGLGCEAQGCPDIATGTTAGGSADAGIHHNVPSAGVD
jgi:hypothetical protein